LGEEVGEVYWEVISSIAESVDLLYRVVGLVDSKRMGRWWWRVGGAPAGRRDIGYRRSLRRYICFDIDDG